MIGALLLLAAGLPGQQPAPASILPDSYAVNATSVMVRRTPTLPGPVIDEVKGHTLFKVVGCSDGWCQVDLGWRAGFGYLPQGQLQPAPPPARSPS